MKVVGALYEYNERLTPWQFCLDGLSDVTGWDRMESYESRSRNDILYGFSLSSRSKVLQDADG